ncbi:acetoin utilization protein AcuC [Devriesea agamarum]|uniref:acetoin utilization protein AcuC n=1 Tax=Devriesea agamarum TaxID=472569 RepID=UPI0009FED41F|nr:acetoin utilization protein AcuC [Devriesea agamarum]
MTQTSKLGSEDRTLWTADGGALSAGDETASAVGVVWDDALTGYDFGPRHPMAPIRLGLTMLLSRSLGILPGDCVGLPAPIASDQDLMTIHDPAYVQAVRLASADPPREMRKRLAKEWGIGTSDVPMFAGMHEASARLVGGTSAAVDAVLNGRCSRAVNIAGGMHHAMPARASGFCVYNDISVGIARALAAGMRRVVYLDLDVHHGDGVERAFWNDPRVVTISVHESGTTLFPGTGFIQDAGGSDALGSALNIPLPPHVNADGWVRAVCATVPALVRAIGPDLLISQHGCDTHACDPLGHLDVTIEAQRYVALMVRDLAREVCSGRWVALGGGGYGVDTVVPRAWTHLLAVVSGHDLDPGRAAPAEYVDAARDLIVRHNLVSHKPLPLPELLTMGDGRAVRAREWADGFDPADPLDRAVMAARRAHFPEWGLDPLYD